jgi:hypothetical protein
MLYIAGELAAAREVVDGLLEQSPKNGNYRRLQAQILTAELPDDATPEQLQAAQDAWAALLQDPTIRRRAPKRFWEARYNWLALLLRTGRPADVDQAISQEMVWYPELGGPPWKQKLLELRDQARTKLRASGKPKPADTQPAP